MTVDELPDPDDLELGAEINGETVQHSRTSQLIFPVSNLIAYLSDTVELYPGDVIFTGTPSGVGVGRTRSGSWHLATNCAPTSPASGSSPSAS